MAIVRGPLPATAVSHPRPLDVALLVEVADSNLEFDRTIKAAAYARASIQVYWIVNLRERQGEVSTDPGGPDETPAFAKRQVYRDGELVPLVLDGVEVGKIAVKDVL